jgi:hypothetical protein
VGAIEAIAIAGYAVAAALGFRAARARGGEALHVRAIAFLLPVGFFVLLGAAAREIADAPRFDYNGARLAATFGLANGDSLYHGPGEGPILSVIYFPLSSILYLPATLARTPNGAILAASTMAAAAFFLPSFLLLWRCARGAGARLWAAGAFLLFGFLVFATPPLSLAAFAAHGDAPGCGFCALACFLVLSPRTTARLAGAALCAALALWTKQTFAPILVALPVFVGLTDGLRRGVFLALLETAFAIFAGAVLWLSFDLRFLVFNAVTVPSRHPWIYTIGFWEALGIAICDFASFAAWPAAMAALLVAPLVAPLVAGSPAGARPEWGLARLRALLAENESLLLLIVAFAMIPTSLAGRMKLGGGESTYGPAMFFLVIGMSILAGRAAAQHWFGGAAPRALAAILFLLISANALFFTTLRWRVDELPKLAQQTAYEYAKKNPGAAYFPWFPLSTFLAEHRILHSSYAVFDREIAGFKPTRVHVRSAIPETIRYIAFKDMLDTYILQYFEEFNRPVLVPELPGWIVYGK